MNLYLSFLGTGTYSPSRYYFDPARPSAPTPFLQEAILRSFLLDFWQPEDRIYTFTTQGAFDKNYRALEDVLKQLQGEGKIGHYEAVSIADGNTVEEIWSVFKTIYDTLKDLPDGSKVYLDITYGFRPLPMLGMVLLNYVQTLHNIAVEQIFYGNFEVGKLQKDEAGLPQSPIIDLRPFLELQEWTTASRAFFKGGNTALLKDLIARTDTAIADRLNDFAQAILTCRGQLLNRDLDIDALKQDILTLKSQAIGAQLRPLLEKVEQQLMPFHSQNTLNGIRAVEWCIANGLIQQGYTFLQETLKSYLLEHTFAGSPRKEAILIDHKWREVASYALNGSAQWEIEQKMMDSGIAANYRYKVYQLHKTVLDTGLDAYYRDLTGRGKGLRNDINHCGFRKNYASPEALAFELSYLLSQIKICLQL